MTRRSMNKQNLSVNQYSFKQVDDLKYLGVKINFRDNMHNEIKLRVNAANRGYCAINKMCNTKLLSRNTKTKRYISYIHPIVMNRCETWSMILADGLSKEEFRGK